jgi:pimeloyl-ACP methyl ester carboxylesterase
MTVQHRDIDGVRLAVDRVGRGRPVVCLSSICHDAHDFDALADRLGDRFKFIRIEWPGHGRSGPDTRPASAERYAELVAATLDELGVERPLVIGNSIGGATAIQVATARPVAGVVLSTAAASCEWMRRFGASAASWRAFSRPARLARGGLAPPSRFTTAWSCRDPPRTPNGRASLPAPMIPRTAGRAREAWLSFARPEADLRAKAAALAMPVWVAWGRRDWATPLSLCRAGIEAIPGVELTLFEGGHSPFLEQPDAFAPAFAAFADRTSP